MEIRHLYRLGPALGLLILGLLAPPTPAQETRTYHLSGTDADHTVLWDFRCSEGRKCGEWTRIPVPSQWEQEGFGHYNYGHDDDKSDEIGEYRTRFKLEHDWRYDRIDLVFGGVMTDTEVWVNGKLAGPVHQGGFYPFRFDITQLLKPDDENLLEVKVSKRSADRSVENAERDADYWVFGGIYRPVWLEAFPDEAIEHVAYDARHDGTLSARVRLRYALREPVELKLTVRDRDGESAGPSIRTLIPPRTREVEIQGRFAAARPWSAEIPDLYTATLSLIRDRWPLHKVQHRIGFRTVEVRPGQGLFVNDQRVLLKGVNRHAFWPATGRSLPRRLDEKDARRIKNMHMNAVRLAHYPPDPAFLDACDRIGLYVLDELAGWHDAYDTKVGEKLVRSTVERDVNHPSILFWNNGNEDGWNTSLDDDFALYDPQQRRVLHPRSLHQGIDTMHYLSWDELTDRLDPKSVLNRWRNLWGPLPLVMPTEILHGLYDGGSGAGLLDFWSALSRSPRAMGLFLWAYTDEAVERTDRDFELDTDGNHAPDGILGPYRETSGNEVAVREVFAPVQIHGEPLDPSWNGSLTLENHFSHLDLSEIRIFWWLLNDNQLASIEPPSPVPQGLLSPPPTPPGGHLTVQLALPEDFRDAEALHVRIVGPPRVPPVDWRRPLKSASQKARSLARIIGPDPRFEDWNGGTRVLAGQTGLQLDSEGNPHSLVNGTLSVPLPRPHAVGQTEPPRATASRRFLQGRSAVVETRYAGDLMYLRWQVFPSGWIRLAWQTQTREGVLPGIVFPLPVDEIDGWGWTGLGPTRVWGNRVHGIWGKHQNLAAAAVAPHQAHEPQFGGYYAARRGTLDTRRGEIQWVLEDDHRFFGLWQPLFPEDARDARAEVHQPDGFAILESIPSIGTKFHPAEDLSPNVETTRPGGLHRGAVWIYPGPTPEIVDPLDLHGTETGDETDLDWP